MNLIPLTQDLCATVDDEDYEYLSQFKWYADKQPNDRTYAARRVTTSTNRSRLLKMHEAIVQRMTNRTYRDIDHKDNNGLNNCRNNLRPATRSQNMANRGPASNNTSGFKGVTPHRDKWAAQITVNYKRLYLGVFESKDDAARTYDEAAIQHFGDFAYLNFPNG